MKLYSIKPLEWTSSANFWKANTTLVSYWVDRTDYGRFELVCMGGRGKEFSHIYQSLDEAKAKAQEDWNNRISQYLTEYKEA